MSEEEVYEEERKRAREGRGSFVPTEAEKDARDRKRKSPSPPPPTQLDFDDDGSSTSGSEVDEVVMLRTPAKPVSQKGLMLSQAVEDVSSSSKEKGEEIPDDDLDIRVPDLHRYFQQFDVADDAVVSMCRAYASYLASQSKKKLQGCLPKRRRKGAEEPVSVKASWAASKKKPTLSRV